MIKISLDDPSHHSLHEAHAPVGLGTIPYPQTERSSKTHEGSPLGTPQVDVTDHGHGSLRSSTEQPPDDGKQAAYDRHDGEHVDPPVALVTVDHGTC